MLQKNLWVFILTVMLQLIISVQLGKGNLYKVQG